MGHLLASSRRSASTSSAGSSRTRSARARTAHLASLGVRLSRELPPGHPYRWLPSARWTISTRPHWTMSTSVPHYYGAANVVLVLAGDIDLPTAREKAQKYFGHIAPGPAGPAGHLDAARTESTRETMHDQVAQTRLHRFWNTAPDGSLDGGAVVDRWTDPRRRQDIAALRAARLSRADGRYGQCRLSGFEIAGLFGITADVKAGVRMHESSGHRRGTEALHRPRDRPTRNWRAPAPRSAPGSSRTRADRRVRRQGRRLAACEVFEGDPVAIGVRCRCSSRRRPSSCARPRSAGWARATTRSRSIPCRGWSCRNERSGPELACR